VIHAIVESESDLPIGRNPDRLHNMQGLYLDALRGGPVNFLSRLRPPSGPTRLRAAQAGTATNVGPAVDNPSPRNSRARRLVSVGASKKEGKTLG